MPCMCSMKHHTSGAGKTESVSKQRAYGNVMVDLHLDSTEQKCMIMRHHLRLHVSP